MPVELRGVIIFVRMNILLAGNRFFPSGGPERYLFNIRSELEIRGHCLTDFALDYPESLPSPHRRYFPPAPAGGGFVRVEDTRLSWRQKAELAFQVIYNLKARRAAQSAIAECGVDLIYATQIAHYLYPELFIAAKKLDVPVVWRQSDFQIICPAYNSLRNGEVCSLCDHSLTPALTHRCVKGSAAMTAVRVLSMHHARLRALDRYPARLVCPTRFMIKRLRDAGFPADKLAYCPTPITDANLSQWRKPKSKENIVLYVGGLYEAKGARVAVEASMNESWKLIIAGDVATPYAKRLQQDVADARCGNIQFVGFAGDEKLRDLYSQATILVIPSLWHENLPNTFLEAKAAGIPVVASDTAGMREFIRHGENGLLFNPGDPAELAHRIAGLLNDPITARKLGEASRDEFTEVHSMKNHLDRLEEIFTQVIREKSIRS